MSNLQTCEHLNTIQLLGGKTAQRPCYNQFPHRHVQGGKPTTKKQVIARPVIESKKAEA